MVGCQPARACLQSVSAVSHVVQSSNLFLYALQRMCSARGHRRVSCHLECDFACSESETGTWPSHHVDKARPQVEGQIAELEAELAGAGDAEKAAVRGSPACNPCAAGIPAVIFPAHAQQVAWTLPIFNQYFNLLIDLDTFLAAPVHSALQALLKARKHSLSYCTTWVPALCGARACRMVSRGAAVNACGFVMATAAQQMPRMWQHRRAHLSGLRTGASPGGEPRHARGARREGRRARGGHQRGQEEADCGQAGGHQGGQQPG